MVYKVIGLMSGSSLDGLDVVYTELNETSGTWSYQVLAADCYAYDAAWTEKLKNAVHLNAMDYQLLHTEYGHYTGEQVNRFIEAHGLHYQVALIASHGHTTFHMPQKKMTAQLGDGAVIAAVTGLPVISDLRALDMAFGGQGAPIVPIGEKLLLKDYHLFLNIGGIANISFNLPQQYIAFDVCPANSVMNTIAQKFGWEYDRGGELASLGNINEELLRQLNDLEYYNLSYPKSLANGFGTGEIYPLIRSFGLTHNDELRTFAEHIVQQIKNAVNSVELKVDSSKSEDNEQSAISNQQLLVTGGGAFNTFLIERLKAALQSLNIDVIVPDENLIKYKEALIMALIGVLRWRQEYNILSSVTGAKRDSIGGALWIGQEG